MQCQIATAPRNHLWRQRCDVYLPRRSPRAFRGIRWKLTRTSNGAVCSQPVVPSHLADRRRSVKEESLLSDFKAGGGDKAKALNVLREAAFKKTVAPDEVVGAIAFLEEEEQGAGRRSVSLAELVGTWALVFSSPSSISAWQYIPVDEVVTIDATTKSIALTSDLGPLFAKFSGIFTYDEEQSAMHWSFSGIEIRVLGWTLLDRSIEMSQKWYAYFGYNKDVICARSSSGFLSLLARRQGVVPDITTST